MPAVRIAQGEKNLITFFFGFHELRKNDSDAVFVTNYN